MSFEILLFNLFYFLIIFSALLVILSENAVYSVLFLILTFCNIIFLLLLMGAEFFAFLLLIVYIGAIAVLFLFVVMMLNIKSSFLFGLNNNLIYFLPIIFVSLLFFVNNFFGFNSSFDVLRNLELELEWTNWFQEVNSISNIKTIGLILYTDYCILFLISSFILLVAMIGVIVLTIHQKSFHLSKKQNINNQLVRNSKNIIKFMNIRK